MKRPADIFEYMRLVDDALYEVHDLIAAAEYDDGDDLSLAGRSSSALLFKLNNLNESLAAGEPGFSGADLPFMAIANEQPDHLLLFEPLLKSINETHRQGVAGALLNE